MDVVLLSRIQFAVASGFHFLFPPLTLGLSFIILILETLYIRNNSVTYRDISNFLIRILALIFTLGVATGIVLEFSFGTNWVPVFRMGGDIFGAPLAAEGSFHFSWNPPSWRFFSSEGIGFHDGPSGYQPFWSSSPRISLDSG